MDLNEPLVLIEDENRAPLLWGYVFALAMLAGLVYLVLHDPVSVRFAAIEPGSPAVEAIRVMGQPSEEPRVLQGYWLEECGPSPVQPRPVEGAAGPGFGVVRRYLVWSGKGDHHTYVIGLDGDDRVVTKCVP